METEPAKPRISRARRVTLIVASVVIATLISGAAWQAEIERQQAVAKYEAALDALVVNTDEVQHQSAVLRNAADAIEPIFAPASAKLNDSKGKVLDESGRTALAEQVDAARKDQAEANELAVALETLAVRTRVDAKNGKWDTAELAVKSQQLLGRVPSGESYIEDLAGWPEVFTASQAKIDEQVKAWEAEQARIAAEKAAQEAAARAAAARRGGGGGAPQAAPGGGRVWTVYVRGWADYSVMQARIDSGGQWATSFGGYGVIVAAHNWSDARALSVRDGDIVQFTGAVGGRYVARGFVNVPTGSSVTVISPLGAGMHLQTCYWGNGRTKVVGLFPV